jgi:hypothetical protein
VEEKTIGQAPGCPQLAGLEALREAASLGVLEGGRPQLVEKANVGPEIASARGLSEASSSRRDKAPATEFRRSGRYSTAKSNPNSLLSH